MPGKMKLGLTVAFLAVGVWLYVLKELGTLPAERLVPLAGLWLVVGIAGIALMRPRSERPTQSRGPNPYERMLDSKRERARAILKARFEGRAVAEEDTNWLSVLLERYAPLLTQSQQMERFTEYLGSAPGA
jgi:hypothetical protein